MKQMFFVFAVAFGLATPAVAGPVSNDYSSFIVFGDSLSDDGKLGPILAAPSSGGRFSNGPVWAEVVAGAFESSGRATANFALGGATAQGPDLTAAAGLARLSNLAGQVGAFTDSLGAIATGDNPLTAVWFGANDLFDNFTPTDVTNTVDAIEAGIRSIAALGSKFDDFLVPNLPDLGATPRYGSLLLAAGVDPTVVDALSGAATQTTLGFNLALGTRMDLLRNEGFNIIDLDVNTLFTNTANAIRTAPGSAEAFGMIDADNPCTVNLGAPLTGSVNPFTCPTGTENLLLFSDAVHPNAVAHAEIGRQALAAIPLPTTAPLLFAAIAGLGFVARRRRLAA